MTSSTLTDVSSLQRQVLDGSSISRRLTLTPASCGHNCLFLAQVSDWTWDTVSTACGTDMYREKNVDGLPTYLSFFYLRISGGPRMQMHGLTFGDVLDVVTTAFNFGTESMLTLHRVSRASGDSSSPRPVDPYEFYERRDDDCMYVESLNRWIVRSRAESNDALVRSSPAGIVTSHLPVLPDRYSPRRAYDFARKAESFHDGADPDYELVVDDYSIDYVIDAARDLNGVGLVFYAAFASIVDSALLKLWRHLGRDVSSFVRRVVSDRQICYVANTDIDSALRMTFRVWRRRDDPRQEVFNVVMRDAVRDRLVLVTTLHIQSENEKHASV